MNNNLIETEEIANVGTEITAVVVGMLEKAKSEGTLNKNIDALNFTFCLWGMTMGMIQLINVRGHLMQQELGLTEETLLNNYLQSLEFGITN